MIGPRMATLLCALVTDFPLSPHKTETTGYEAGTGVAQRFRQVIDRTFNSISVDGHTSTSDQVILFAPRATEATDPRAEDEFFEQLEAICEELAKLIPADGEGATHLIAIEVRGAYAESQLRSVAKAIVDSPLVKTAVFGADPNWGRIVSAAGYSGLGFEPAETSLWVNGHLLFQHGTPVKFDAAQVSASMREQFETEITLEVSQPPADANWNSVRYWGCDLTYDYVRINAEYHT